MILHNKFDLAGPFQAQLGQFTSVSPSSLGVTPTGMMPSRTVLPYQPAGAFGQIAPVQFSPRAELVAQMQEVFLGHLHGPAAAVGHYALLAGNLVVLEDNQKIRRDEVEPRGLLWSDWGQKLMGLLAPFFSSVELRQQTMEVARELEKIERRALVRMQEAKLEHYQDQFDTWRRVEISRQTLLMIQGVVVQIANDIIASVRGLSLSEENQEEMAKILFEKFAIPKLLHDLGIAEEGGA